MCISCVYGLYGFVDISTAAGIVVADTAVGIVVADTAVAIFSVDANGLILSHRCSHLLHVGSTTASA